LLETLKRLEEASADGLRYHRLARENLARWAAAVPPGPTSTCVVRVLPGDWGEVTHALTKQYGKCFASLNMANAYGPGGGYTDGMVAQEENMFRRTGAFRCDPNRAHPGLRTCSEWVGTAVRRLQIAILRSCARPSCDRMGQSSPPPAGLYDLCSARTGHCEHRSGMSGRIGYGSVTVHGISPCCFARSVACCTLPLWHVRYSCLPCGRSRSGQVVHVPRRILSGASPRGQVHP
jgi:hypothetical protein